MKVVLILFSMILSLNVNSQGKGIPNTASASFEAQYMAIAPNIYSRSGLLKEKISWEAFDLAFREYLVLKEKQKVTQPHIIFVNFTLPSSKKRMVIANVEQANPGVIAKMEVAHGRRSGSYRTANKFSNKDSSFQSSLGAYVLLGKYSSKKFKEAMTIDGVTSGFNTQAKSRAVVFHNGWYVNSFIAKVFGRVGKSLGCFTVSKKKARSVIKSFGNRKAMIYAYHDDWVSKKGSRCRQEKCLPRLMINKTGPAIASTGVSTSAPIITDQNVPTPETSSHFSGSGQTNATRNGLGKGKDGFLSMGKLLGISLVGSAMLPTLMKKNPKKEPARFRKDFPTVKHEGSAKFTGSRELEVCQQLANKEWSEVVTRAQNGEDPHKFFKASWKDLSRTVQSPLAIDNYQVPLVARNHLNKVRECAALSLIFDKRNFEIENPNKKRKILSRDKKISCRYQSSESVDYHDCLSLMKKHEEFIQEEKRLFANQGESIKGSGKEVLKNVSSDGNVQSSAHVAQESMRQNVMGLTRDRSAFQEARLRGIAKSLSALPSHRSLMRKCQDRYSPHNKGGIDDYMVFNSLMAEGFPYDLGSGILNDPCAGAVNKLNISYVQNHHVRKQAEKVLEEVGVKKQRLAVALKTLETQKGVNFKSSKREYSERISRVGSINSNDLNASTNNDPLKYSNSKKVVNGQNLSNAQTGSSGQSISDKGAYSDSENHSSQGGRGSDSEYSGLKKQKTRSGISDDSKFDSALSELQNGKLEKMTNLIKSGEVPWNDALYMYQNGKISDSQIKRLSMLTGNKIVRLATVNDRNNENSAFDINKNKERSIFSIISRRYATKKLGQESSSSKSK